MDEIKRKPEDTNREIRNLRFRTARRVAAVALISTGAMTGISQVFDSVFMRGAHVESCEQNPYPDLCNKPKYEDKHGPSGPDSRKKPMPPNVGPIDVKKGDEPIPYVPYDPNYSDTTTSATGSDNFDVSYDISGGTTTSANVSGNFEIEIVLKQNNVPVIT